MSSKRLLRYAVAVLTVGGSLAVAGPAQAGPAQAVTALAVTASTAKPVVTPAQAKATVKAFFAANAKANAAYDVALQDKHERDSAAAIDDALFRIGSAVALPHGPPFTPTAITVFLPRQTHYPAIFVVEFHARFGQLAVAPDTSLLLFKKSTSHDTWRVASEPDILPGSPLPRFTPGKDGYLPTLDPATLADTPAQLEAQWVTVQTTLSASHQAAATWARTPLVKSYLATDPANVLLETDHYARTPYGTDCVATSDGAACFASALWTADLTESPARLAAGDRIVVSLPSDQYTFGGVAAGSYTSLQVLSQREAVIVVPLAPAAHKKAAGLQWLGAVAGPLHGTGTLG